MRVRYTRQARDDLKSIDEYLRTRSVAGARNVRARVKKTVQALSAAPGLGRPTERPRLRVIGTRRYPYLIFYRMGDDAVVIVHIRHAAREDPGDDVLA